MRSSTLRFFILFAAYAALLSCAKPKSEKDCGFVQNAYGERVSWKSSVPIRMYIHSSVPAEFESSIRRAAETWNHSYGRTLLVIENNRIGGYAPARDTTNVIYYMNTWEADRASEQARTSLYWVGDQIQEADIRINAYNYKFYADQTSISGEVNIEALVLHEMGHVLGLRHNDASPSVMATYLKANQNRTQLEQTDSSSLKCEY